MEEIFDIALDITTDAFFDSLRLLPFLFLTYLAMEWLEHKAGDRNINAVKKAGAAGPALGALLGVIPQCGFSAAASTFYAGRVITLGTLFAVYLSTSDEMLPIFIAQKIPVTFIVGVLVTKVLVGMVFGFVVDIALRRSHKISSSLAIHDLCEDAHCLCEEHCAGEDSQAHHHTSHDKEHCHHEHGTGSIVGSAFKHTLQIIIFIFLVSIVLNLVLELIGEEAITGFLGDHKGLSVLTSSLVGLIPNCAASVAIAQLYAEGILSYGAMLAGLLCSAGIGLLVLVRTNKHQKENALIIVTLFSISVIVGFVASFMGL